MNGLLSFASGQMIAISPPMIVAAVALVAVTLLVIRGVDVRLVLILGALPLFAVLGDIPAMVHTIADEMVKKQTVVPICAAVGFSFTLRFTECDTHLVRLLVQPLRRVRALLIPGGIMAGYLINTTVVSQAGTAAVLGPVLIPLLKGAGLGPAQAGSVLLLGSSMGGELFNPGAVEIRKLAELADAPSSRVVAQGAPLNLLACGVAAATFWLLSARRSRTQPLADTASPDQSASPEHADRINILKAIVPALPLVILAVDAIVGPNRVTGPIEGPTKILAAMLVGTLAAGLTRIRTIGHLPVAFFDGAGYGYTHVVSLIIAASTFAEGIRRSGLIGPIIKAIAPWPRLTMAAATVIPCGLAVVCGSGIAPAVSIMEFFVPVSATLGIDPIRLGTLTAMGAHFGRTMSPAAAVVAMSARLSGASSVELIKGVALPLLAGMIALIAAAFLDGGR
jgi:DcuC family C4-dicarboxylate transporter